MTHFLQSLGNAPAGQRLSPPPRAASFRKPNYLPPPKPRPSERTDPAVVQMAMASTCGLAASVVQLDYFTRQLQDSGMPREKCKLLVGRLVDAADNALVKLQDQFGSQEADQVNALGDVLGRLSHLAFQLTGNQLAHALNHMQAMAESNLAYTPADYPKK